MNILSLIRAKHKQAIRLHEAQLLHLKAYRGVPYQNAPVSPKSEGAELTYIGHSYTA